MKKLLLYHHLLSLDNDTLAKEILNIQIEEKLQGLASECSSFLCELKIYNDPLFFSKSLWNKQIKSKIHEKNRSELLNRIRSYSKLEYSKFVNEEYGQKEYLNNMKINDARTYFAMRGRMLRTVQMNFKNKPEYIANQYKCICGEDDHQVHLTMCPSYAHLREGLDLDESDNDLVRYYQMVIREREQGENN